MEKFDGIKIVHCPKCKANFRIFFKDGEKLILCPACDKKLEDKDIIKTINKKVMGVRNFDRSVPTDKCFNY